MATRTLAYECRYCGALKKTKATCERHELACLKNPEAKNCTVCEHAHKSTAKGRLICAISHKLCSTAVSARCNMFKRRDTQ